MSEELLLEILEELGEMRKIFERMATNIEKWKEWDRKHHLKEVKNERLIKELIKNKYEVIP